MDKVIIKKLSHSLFNLDSEGFVSLTITRYSGRKASRAWKRISAGFL